MNGPQRIFLLVILLLLVHFPWSQRPRDQQRYITLYQKAEKLYYDDKVSDYKDSLALVTYKEVIALHPQTPDSILWDSYFKAGIFLQTAEKFGEAVPYLVKAVSMQGVLSAIPENLFYLPNLYLGNSYYSMSMLDSAAYYYKKAEQIATKYPHLEGIPRLYNTLGAINYESGDYQQSKIYFEKARLLLEQLDPANTALRVNYINNLASAFRQLKEYDKALELFQQLLRYNVNKDEITHNIAAIYLEQGKDSLAIAWLHRVKYNNQNKLNDLGIAYMKDGDEDSALYFFRSATDLNGSINGDRKNVQFAITCKNLGDYFVSEINYDSALIEYQQAIIQLVFDFNDPDPRINPNEFNGQFSVKELFEALALKASTYTLRYQSDNNKNDLLASIYAYDALYKLADYVIRTYNSDEARLLLANRKHLSHTEPIDNSLRLYEITGDEVYLRHAFRFDEKNKATLLALQLQESGSKAKAGLPAELIQQEKILKREITNLQLTQTTETDSTKRDQRENELRDKQILLATLHKKFDEFPAYTRLKFIDNTTGMQDVMKIIPDNYAVLTYHMGDTNMLAFVLKNNSFKHFVFKKDSLLPRRVQQLYDLIKVTDRNVGESVDSLSDVLYNILLQPVAKQIAAVENLIIIPDDELSYLPFEILKKRNGEILLRSHSITYNYSCSLLKPAVKDDNSKENVLAIAPFTETLPESLKEISAIKGDKLVGPSATKKNFLDKAASYSLIHLATHATANDVNPSASYIQFYCKDSSSGESRLYTSEISNLLLNKADLVVLSACETASGQLVKGEGLMSLTRSFSNAGCRNVIASLWKADDAATAFICKRLHKYLGEGKTPADALKRAKTDYLDGDDIANRKKLPAYWAHLRLVGSFEERSHSYQNLLIIILALLAVGSIIYFARRRSSF